MDGMPPAAAHSSIVGIPLAGVLDGGGLDSDCSRMTDIWDYETALTVGILASMYYI